MIPSLFTFCTSLFDNFGVHSEAKSGSEREPKIGPKTEPFPTSFQGFLAPTRAGTPNSGGPAFRENEKSSWPFIYKYLGCPFTWSAKVEIVHKLHFRC